MLILLFYQLIFYKVFYNALGSCALLIHCLTSEFPLIVTDL